MLFILPLGVLGKEISKLELTLIFKNISLGNYNISLNSKKNNIF